MYFAEVNLPSEIPLQFCTTYYQVTFLPFSWLTE